MIETVKHALQFKKFKHTYVQCHVPIRKLFGRVRFYHKSRQILIVISAWYVLSLDGLKSFQDLQLPYRA